MRILLIALALALQSVPPVHARSFVQTYGSTVPTSDGGCVWNLNQDYFVPRYCRSGGYGLHGACTHRQPISAACRNQHPVYGGYCTPFGSCRYCWRDCVYGCYCGCAKWKCYRGPWRLEACPRLHCCLRHVRCRRAEDRCACCVDGVAGMAPYEPSPSFDGLAHIEPLGGETLGVLRSEVGLGDLAGLAGGNAGGRPGASTARPRGEGTENSEPNAGLLPSLGIDLPSLGL